MPEEKPGISPEILTRMDIGFEQTQLALLLLHKDKALFPDTVDDLAAIMVIWDRIREVHQLT